MRNNRNYYRFNYVFLEKSFIIKGKILLKGLIIIIIYIIIMK